MSTAQFDAVALTHPGRRRENNEDSVFCEPPDSERVARAGLLAAVADGIGGAAYGEVASKLALEMLRDDYYDEGEGDKRGERDVAQRLGDAVYAANQALLADAQREPRHSGMGTTLVAAVFEPDRMTVAHVGDSRAYLVRDDTCQQLTRDHSLVAEAVARGDLTESQAREHPHRNIITRALGSAAASEPDLAAYALRTGDVTVLCTDGLHGVVTPEQIAAAVKGKPAAQAVQDLVDLANDGGGPDNIGVVVVRRL